MGATLFCYARATFRGALTYKTLFSPTWVTTMGNILGTRGDHSHVAHVRTGDRKGAGTDANIWLVLHDTNGKTSKKTKLNSFFKNDNERGKTSVFQVHAADDELDAGIAKIEFWRDSFGIADDWFVDVIHIECVNTGVLHSFPIQRWIKANHRYMFSEFDSCLPQNDTNQVQRSVELEQKRQVYQYVTHIKDGPAQIKKLPDDEQFSDSYKWDIISQKAKLMIDSMLIRVKTEGRWESLNALKGIYKYGLPEPKCLPHWRHDKWFGLQRLQGCNPIVITLCEQIPEKFGVEAEMLEPFLEGMTLDAALRNNKIFYVDLNVLKDLKCKNNRVLCSPFALFYLNKNNEFLPIAIQLFQDKGPQNPVFLPTDPPYTWLLAKMYYNNAEATHHQSLTHLGFTHLMMEGIAVCAHRNLSPSHPLFRLMAPHFLFLLAINSRGLDKLVSPGGWVDKTMTVGRDGMFALICRGYKTWKLDLNANIPLEIETRKVMDPNILPYYPYRDEAVPLYFAIRRYVNKIVAHFYDTEDKIREDCELQAFRSELVASKNNNNGVGMLGVPGDEVNGLTTLDQVTELITGIISTCSLSHAVANFQQYDQYAFPPNYPGILMGELPTDKRPLTEKELVKHIPDKLITVDTMVITKLLSNKGTKSLSDFEVQYAYDPVSIEAAKEFREDLKKLAEEAKFRNGNREFPYPWLDAEIIPNSISI